MFPVKATSWEHLSCSLAPECVACDVDFEDRNKLSYVLEDGLAEVEKNKNDPGLACLPSGLRDPTGLWVDTDCVETVDEWAKRSVSPSLSLSPPPPPPPLSLSLSLSRSYAHTKVTHQNQDENSTSTPQIKHFSKHPGPHLLHAEGPIRRNKRQEGGGEEGSDVQ